MGWGEARWTGIEEFGDAMAVCKDASAALCLEDLAKRFDRVSDAHAVWVARCEPPGANWRSLALLELLREGLESLRSSLDDPDEGDITWDNLWIEAQYPIEWDWENGEPSLAALSGHSDGDPGHRPGSLTDIPEEGQRFEIFQLLTRRALHYKSDNQILQLPPRLPLFGPEQDPAETLQFQTIALTDELRRISELSFRGEARGKGYEGSLVVDFQPLMVDEDAARAYYPVEIGIVLASLGTEDHRQERDPRTLPIPKPDTWSAAEQNAFWDALFRALTERMAVLSSSDTSWEDRGVARVDGAGQRWAHPAPSFPKVVPTRRSVMSPVPVPRAGVKHAASLALTRGLGRMFSNYERIPDLDIRGEAATAEAEAIFWQCFQEHLELAVAKRKGSSYESREKRGTKVLILHGFSEDEAAQLWADVTQAMNKREGGPGIQVSKPAFETARSFDREKQTVRVETRISFWPENVLQDQDGWDVSPIRFRNEGSPGYIALLERHRQRPYFADGWLWIPRDREREGFRIGGLSTLLFPEGRAALERVKERELTDYESELNRIFQQPSLFRDHDTRAVQQLRAAIRRVQSWLKNLSTYEISHDLILCIFEAFFWQRDAWIKQTLRLPDGREIDTTPWRTILLDPEALRIRLDPSERWGPNWRNRLFEKLEALTTFERQTRTVTGRKIDVGDRFLGRVIDGYHGVVEGSAPETDTGLGLTRVLKRAGAFPINAFFVEVSIDFMERLVTWAVDESGKVHWGIDAAKAAERAALVHYPDDPKKARQLAENKVQEAKTNPYYEHSPRLLTLGNLEGWPIERKLLANVLLQEVTPNFESPPNGGPKARKRRSANKFGGKESLVTIDGMDFVSCNGTHGHGYRIRTWIAKVGYEKRRGRDGRGEVFHAFVTDLRALADALDLQLRIKDFPGNTDEVLRRLENFRRVPSTAPDLVLRAHLPLDLEARLRRRLAQVGIEAIDAEESLQPVDLPATPGGLAPAQIRRARKNAKLTQAQLAQRIGITQGLLSQWERAKEPISPERMALLMEVLADHMDPA